MSKLMDIILGVAFVALFTIVISGFVSDLATNTELTTNNLTLNDSYNKMDSIRNITADMESDLKDAKLESSSVFVVATEAPFKALKIMATSVGVAYSIVGLFMGDVAISMGLDPMFGTIALVFITITFVALIIGAFLRWRV